MVKADSTDCGTLKLRIYESPAQASRCLPRGGYTLVELAVAMVVIGLMAMMAIYGLKTFRNTTPVDNAQKEFVVNLRTAQSRIDNGEVVTIGVVDKVIGEVTIPANSASYTINGKAIELKDGVRVVSPSGPLTICLPNRNLSQYDSSPAHRCGSCNSNADGYICRGGNPQSPASVEIQFQKGSFIKRVVIYGTGMRVNQIDPL